MISTVTVAILWLLEERRGCLTIANVNASLVGHDPPVGDENCSVNISGIPPDNENFCKENSLTSTVLLEKLIPLLGGGSMLQTDQFA